MSHISCPLATVNIGEHQHNIHWWTLLHIHNCRHLSSLKHLHCFLHTPYRWQGWLWDWGRCCAPRAVQDSGTRVREDVGVNVNMCELWMCGIVVAVKWSEVKWIVVGCVDRWLMWCYGWQEWVQQQQVFASRRRRGPGSDALVPFILNNFLFCLCTSHCWRNCLASTQSQNILACTWHCHLHLLYTTHNTPLAVALVVEVAVWLGQQCGMSWCDWFYCCGCLYLIYVEQVLRDADEVCRLMALVTGQTASRIHQDLTASPALGLYLTAAQAVTYGVLDRVLGPSSFSSSSLFTPSSTSSLSSLSLLSVTCPLPLPPCWV